MAMLRIPTDSPHPSYSQRTILDGREYILDLDWNQRDARWYLSLADQDGSPIFQGVRVVANYPLARFLTDSRAPRGTLLAYDTTGEGRDPGLTDLGSRVWLVYVEAEANT